MATVPNAPTGLVAVSDVGSVDLSWAVPSSDGGSAITGYNVFLSTTSGTESPTCADLITDYATCNDLATSGLICSQLFTTPFNGSLITSTSYTATGLTNGTTYYFTVEAVNAIGPSGPSAEASATPALQVPGSPTGVSAKAANAAADVFWTAPSFDGGSAITGFTVTSSPGGVTATAGPSDTAALVTGLSNFITYTFTVVATNGVGNSAPSAPSNSVTPESTPQPPTANAVVSYDPLRNMSVVTITVVADTTAAPNDFTMAATLLRSDGTYVIGASPLNPLTVPLDTSTASIVDYSAAYAVEVSYVANIIFSSAIAPVLSSPSAPSPPVLMGQAPDTIELYSRMGWAKDEDVTGELEQWLAGIGQMMQTVDNLCQPGFDSEGNPTPAWSQILDINRAPTYVLPWLAQFLGVRLDPTLRDDEQRYLIENPPGFGRGTTGALIAAANQYLQPGYTVTLAERDTSPYHLTITVPSVAIIGASSCLSILQQYATCSDLPGAFATCADLWKTDADIGAAIDGSIPAGLVADVVYV